MTKLQRFKTILGALLMLACCAVLIIRSDLGFNLVAVIVAASMIVKGVGSLSYYGMMARHMVGGKMLLYKGIIMMDIGLFFLTLDDIPRIYLVLYLMIGSLIAGVIDVMRALEARRMESGAWTLSMAVGAINILSAAACVLCINRSDVLVYIYAGGLFYTACLRIASAIRRSAIIYIP